MVYFKAKLKAMAIKHHLVSNHSEYEMHLTDFYLCGIYYRFNLTILISLTSSMGIPNSMIILHNTSLLSES
jgi:predicted ATP-dependent Lon-type protease